MATRATSSTSYLAAQSTCTCPTKKWRN